MTDQEFYELRITFDVVDLTPDQLDELVDHVLEAACNCEDDSDDACAFMLASGRHVPEDML